MIWKILTAMWSERPAVAGGLTSGTNERAISKINRPLPQAVLTQPYKTR